MTDLGFLASPAIILALLGGTVWGVVMGVLPGITGLSALIMALPFAVSLGPEAGLVLLISIHAVADIGGAVTAIAMAIPGTPSNAATVEDGHALARAGHTARAIAASSFASSLGGILGFLLLAATLPFSVALVRAAGAPEIFALCCLGLLSAARLGSSSLARGLFALAFGVFAGLVGTQNASGEPRLWFGFESMLDGFELLAVATGLFAGPELVRLVVGRSPIPVGSASGVAAVAEGWRDTIARPGILLKSSLVGWLVGIMPGVGGSVSSFLAYAWSGAAGPGARDIGRRLDGVIAAEAGNNAKEGGDLVPTLTLGLPGGAGMAVLVGAFMMFGIAPGPDLATTRPDLVIAIALGLLVSNILGGLLVAFGGPVFVRLLRTPPEVLAPLAICLAAMGVLGVRGELFDLWTAAVFCLIGLAMVAQGYSRPAFILGFVLAPVIETYGSIAYKAYGWSFLARPGVMLAAVVAAIMLVAGRQAIAAGRTPT